MNCCHVPYCFPHTGMDFYVVLERPGYRVARRRKQLAKVGVQHRITKEVRVVCASCSVVAPEGLRVWECGPG